eukprot:Nk52_evm13s2118 gene=Nk52_evmTU13s2118
MGEREEKETVLRIAGEWLQGRGLEVGHYHVKLSPVQSCPPGEYSVDVVRRENHLPGVRDVGEEEGEMSVFDPGVPLSRVLEISVDTGRVENVLAGRDPGVLKKFLVLEQTRSRTHELREMLRRNEDRRRQGLDISAGGVEGDGEGIHGGEGEVEEEEGDGGEEEAAVVLEKYEREIQEIKERQSRSSSRVGGVVEGEEEEREEKKMTGGVLVKKVKKREVVEVNGKGELGGKLKIKAVPMQAEEKPGVEGKEKGKEKGSGSSSNVSLMDDEELRKAEQRSFASVDEQLEKLTQVVEKSKTKVVNASCGSRVGVPPSSAAVPKKKMPQDGPPSKMTVVSGTTGAGTQRTGPPVSIAVSKRKSPQGPRSSTSTHQAVSSASPPDGTRVGKLAVKKRISPINSGGTTTSRAIRTDNLVLDSIRMMNEMEVISTGTGPASPPAVLGKLNPSQHSPIGQQQR